MDITKFTVEKETSVLNTMKVIDSNARQIAFVCEIGKMVAVVTDGDIRRHILRGGTLSADILSIANPHPHFILEGEAADPHCFMMEHSINAVPIVTPEGKIVSIEFLNSKRIYDDTNLCIPVVIQAGGKGTRLKPFTQVIPKPLISIGEKTIIELIMDRFCQFSCNQFDVIVNYKKNLIKAFFMDHELYSHVGFIDESEFLGTGGGLRLLSGKYHKTFFLSNCDILIEEDYSKILKHHRERRNIITMVCAVKNVTIPYGTIDVDSNGNVIALREKPNLSFITNTGFYVIEPSFLEKIPPDTFIHITDVIQTCIDQGDRVGMYPISENAWMDMGQIEEMERMRDKLSVCN